jgi:hypothetical protein
MDEALRIEGAGCRLAYINRRQGASLISTRTDSTSDARAKAHRQWFSTPRLAHHR